MKVILEKYAHNVHKIKIGNQPTVELSGDYWRLLDSWTLVKAIAKEMKMKTGQDNSFRSNPNSVLEGCTVNGVLMEFPGAKDGVFEWLQEASNILEEIKKMVK